MTDWKSPVEVQKNLAVALIFMWVCVGAAAYDHFRRIPFDLSVIKGERSRRWPQVFYFATKIFWWAYIAASIVLCYATTEVNCNATIRATEFFMGAITICCSALLACRTMCVWQGKARLIVNTIVGVFAFALAAVWMAGVPDITAVWAPGAGASWTEGACKFTSVPVRYSVKYIVTIAFDFTVLILTVAGIFQMQSSGTHLGQLLISQGVVYFLATFMANAIVCALCIARLNNIMSLAAAIPSSLVAMISSAELYVSLAKESRPRSASGASPAAPGAGAGGAPPAGAMEDMQNAFYSTASADKWGSFFHKDGSRSQEARRFAAFINGQDLEQGDISSEATATLQAVGGTQDASRTTGRARGATNSSSTTSAVGGIGATSMTMTMSSTSSALSPLGVSELAYDAALKNPADASAAAQQTRKMSVVSQHLGLDAHGFSAASARRNSEKPFGSKEKQ